MAHVVGLVNTEADRTTFTWSDGPASFQPYRLDGQVFLDFKEAAEEAREKLSELVKDYLYNANNVPAAAFAMAESGYELYEQIFDPGAGQARTAREARNWLESLRATKDVDTLEIVVECPWAMPWNIVYDQPPDKEAFLSENQGTSHWKPFWGVRYNLTGGRKVSPLRRLPFLTKPDVLLVVDRAIRDGLPADQQRRLAQFIESHDLKVVTTKDELEAAVKSGRPDLVYWLSHATPSALVLDDEKITPRRLRRLFRKYGADDAYKLGGLAFLNACQTAEMGGAGSFFDALHSVGFSGMIGTEHQTVDTFANPLGLDFLEEFLYQKQPIGRVMRNLRARVPLGLLYGTYCPPNIRVKEPTSGEESKDSVDIVPLLHAHGATLGEMAASIRQPSRLPAEPYRSLAFYSYEDRALFAGRDDDVERFATILDDADSRMLVLHGESGVGKSSFLRAGVIPYLEEECIGYRFLREHRIGEAQRAEGDESVLFVRATNDLFGQLAQALCDYCSRPYQFTTPTGKSVQVDLPGVLAEVSGTPRGPAALREALRNDPSLLGRLLSAISDRLPFAAVLVVDQCEEVFTLSQSPEDAQTRELALDMLRQAINAPGDFKIILSLRTEYYGRMIDRLRRGLHDIGGIREYLLTDFDQDSLVEAVTRPTVDDMIPHSAEVPRKRYGFRYEEGVPETIADRVVRYTTHRRDSVLTLVQVICTQLYELAQTRQQEKVKLITEADLDQLGGIEGGMRRHVEVMVGRLLREHPRDQKSLQKLFTQLYLRQPDGSLTTALLPEDDVARRWDGRMPIQQLLKSAQEMRLLRVNSLRIGGVQERRYVSLGHDALAKLAADWDDELSRGARVRKMVAAIAGACSVALAMAGLAVWALINAGKAEDNLKKALGAVEEYYTTTSEETLLNQPGMGPLRRELLDNAVSFLEDFIREYGDRTDVRRQVAQANFNVGLARAENESFAEAADYFDKARKVFGKLVSVNPDDLNITEDLSKAWFEMGSAHFEGGHWNQALTAYTQAADLRKRMVERVPTNAEFNRLLANAYMDIGNTLNEIALSQYGFNIAGGDEDITPQQAAIFRQRQIEKLDEARRMMLEAQRIRNAFKNDPKISKDLGDGHYNLALLEDDRLLKLAEKKAYDDSDRHDKEEYTDELLESKLFATDRRQIRAQHAKDACEAFRFVLKKDPSDQEAQFHLATAYSFLADVEVEEDEEDVDNIHRLLFNSWQLMEPLAHFNPTVLKYQEELINILIDSMYASSKTEHFERRLNLLERALHSLEEKPDYETLLGDAKPLVYKIRRLRMESGG